MVFLYMNFKAVKDKQAIFLSPDDNIFLKASFRNEQISQKLKNYVSL